MPDHQPGLRQRKKERTRRAITDAAMAMFLEHGFENVSIIKIAAAAEVSVQTVYNYFPAKADLVFDEADQITSDLQRAVRHRPPGQSALSAIRGYFASLPARVGGRRRTGQGLASGHGTGQHLPVDRVHAGRPHGDPDLPRPRVRNRSVFPHEDLGTSVRRKLQRSHATVLPREQGERDLSSPLA